ncbi:MAG: hypothetical protein K8R58_14165 [Bacteroidales bacterium]|nr:hypothetical protein [Bacteroidales bacterium]
MKVTGFSFIRNAKKFDYPIIEAITSILPICNEFVIAVGKSEDKTLELIQSIKSSKIKIINTIWDDTLREGGKVLADETNKAFQNIQEDSDWAFYIQGDEVVHEKYLPVINDEMLKWKDDKKVEGLLFNYLHFYGSYDYIGDSRRWYRKEVRIIRNNKKFHSFRDAQGFRNDNKLLRVKQVNATVYHYGWVKPPALQQAKQESFNKLWHNDDWVDKNIKKYDEFDYSMIDSLARFNGTHPKVIQERIKNQNWKFSFDPIRKNFSLKTKFLYFIEKYTGWRVGEYKNYRLLKKMV